MHDTKLVSTALSQLQTLRALVNHHAKHCESPYCGVSFHAAKETANRLCVEAWPDEAPLLVELLKDWPV